MLGMIVKWPENNALPYFAGSALVRYKFERRPRVRGAVLISLKLSPGEGASIVVVVMRTVVPPLVIVALAALFFPALLLLPTVLFFPATALLPSLPGDPGVTAVSLVTVIGVVTAILIIRPIISGVTRPHRKAEA
jgi:hypothetical protein